MERQYVTKSPKKPFVQRETKLVGKPLPFALPEVGLIDRSIAMCHNRRSSQIVSIGQFEFTFDEILSLRNWLNHVLEYHK